MRRLRQWFFQRTVLGVVLWRWRVTYEDRFNLKQENRKLRAEIERLRG